MTPCFLWKFGLSYKMEVGKKPNTQKKGWMKMKRENKRYFWGGILLLALFVGWTLLVRYVDVRAIGPNGSAVGLGSINGFVHRMVGVHLWLYVWTDWLSLIPIAFIMGFGILGLLEWIQRKSIKKVDADLLVLGGFYIVVMAFYLLFETVVINYRPVLLNGFLESSYPSSTTLLVLCVMPTAILQMERRIKHRGWRKCVVYAMAAFTVCMVIGRFVSGVHWFSDIVGGVLLGTGLVMIYRALIK